MLALLKIRSVLAVPIQVGSEWWGYIQLEDCTAERSWPALLVDAVKAVAGMLGAVFQRQHALDVERKLTQVKDDFIASLSHELRTPLYAITGFIELLQRNKVKDPATQQEFMGRIAQNADRLVTLVDELLDASRLETGRLQLDLAAVDICDVVVTTLRSLESLAAQKNINLVLQACQAGSVLVQADAHRLRQVLVNIVGNAIKFSRVGDRSWS